MENESAPRTPAAERRIRDVLEALAIELELFDRAGRLHQAMAGASWRALKAISRMAGTLVAPPGTTPGPATRLRHAAEREIARRPCYQISERLGVGGMAEVFRGWQLGEAGFERPVAIKRLLPKLAPSPWMVSHEADVLARMQHPNIVHVVDVVRDEDGQLLLVLEYVDGVHLGDLIATGPVPVSVIVFLAAEILSGLGYAHHLPANGSGVHGVVHRDLSPDNVLLSWDGAVKIVDFGIAKQRDTNDVSMTPCVQGKPAYMSPEQHRGQPLDGRSDLYSVGVMLWELLAHERLFADRAENVAVASQFDRLLPRPSMFRPVPRDVETVVMKLLGRDREQRYRTAEVACDAIAQCDGASLLRGRVALVELLAERFPEQAARRPTRRPPLRRYSPTPRTPTLPPPSEARRAVVWERWNRWRWSMRRAQSVRQRRRAPRLLRDGWPAMSIAVAFVCMAAVLALVIRVALP